MSGENFIPNQPATREVRNAHRHLKYRNLHFSDFPALHKRNGHLAKIFSDSACQKSSKRLNVIKMKKKDFAYFFRSLFYSFLLTNEQRPSTVGRRDIF